MFKGLFLLMLMISVMTVMGQFATEEENKYSNSAGTLLQNNTGLVIGGYGEVHMNSPLNAEKRNIAALDVHRLVMLLGYNFNENVQFVSELEFEHVKEVYVEQAFLQYKLNQQISLRGGLMLVPMGIINEYHEPTTFNGVERPLIDKYLTPSTWREIGIGVNGNLLDISIKYQAYLFNGFNGYDGSAKLNGSNGLRKGRQKGAESYMSSPNFSGKIEYYGIGGLNIGLSGYWGDTQSKLYDGISKMDETKFLKADSSSVGLSMVGIDARYRLKGLQMRGQFYHASLSNTNQYNSFTASESGLNDLGSAMLGYYIEMGYNLLRSTKSKMKLVPFVRYEFLNTHHKVVGDVVLNPAYKKTAISTGITWELTRGAVLKSDIQFLKDAQTNTFSSTLNLGIGVMF